MRTTRKVKAQSREHIFNFFRQEPLYVVKLVNQVKNWEPGKDRSERIESYKERWRSQLEYSGKDYFFVHRPYSARGLNLGLLSGSG